MSRFKLGLTGSIGMGKSTTAAMFADEGCAVWDADAAVHRLYAEGGAAVAPLTADFPELAGNNSIPRDILREIIAKDASALKKIEAIVHPLVAKDRESFLADQSEDIVVLDIPLIFETGAEKKFDAVACVDVDLATQEARVLARGTMTKAQFEQIRAKQLPNAEKTKRADYVITTDTLEHARRQVQDIVADIRRRLDARNRT